LPVEGETKVPVDVFGSGPHVIDVGARLGDKITVAVGAEPERVGWAVKTAREARRIAGLDPETMEIGAFVVVGAGTELLELSLSHLVIVGGSRDIDATVRERSDHLVAKEMLRAVQAVALPGKPARQS
jgi:hypothetical protein